MNLFTRLSDMTITKLPQSTIKLLSCSQVITSVSSAVKELIENSLDAGASNIDVKLENHGLDRIEVKDDGTGISPANSAAIGLAHCTSKISAFSDIESLETYGFRGEALNALCQVGNVTITSATDEDATGMIYVLDKNGQVASSKPTHKIKGTTVVVAYLFKNIPVRWQFYSNNKRAKEELRQVENIVKSLGVINPQVRLTLWHNKCMIWQKTSVTLLRQGVVYMIGYTPARELHELTVENAELRIEALLPRIGCDISILMKATPDWSMVFINRRPVQFKKVYKVVCEHVTYQFGEKLLQRKSPIFVVSFTMGPAELDVNLEPNKTRVLVRNEFQYSAFKDGKSKKWELTENLKSAPTKCSATCNKQDGLLEELRKLLTEYYGSPTSKEEVVNVESPAKKRRLELSEETLQPSKPVEILLENPQENCVDKNPARFESSLQGRLEGQPKNPQGVAAVAVRRTSLDEKENVADTRNPAKNYMNKMTIKSSDQSMTAEKWSMGHVHVDNTTTAGRSFIEGPGVLIKGPESAPSVRETPHLPVAPSTCTNALSVDEERQPAPARPTADFVRDFSSIEMREFEKDWSLSDGADFVRLDTLPAAGNCAEGLGPVKSPPRQRNEKNRRKPLQLVPRDDEIDLSVSSQMGRREFAGFTKFARDVRPQIILDNPGIAFTKVAVMLSDKWKNLPSTDREAYEEKARDHIAARKKQYVEDASQPKLSFEPREKPPAQKDKPVTSSLKPSNFINFNHPHTPYRVSLDIIKERLQTENFKKTEAAEDDCVPVGRLHPSGGWICRRGKKDILLISPYRLQEIVLSHRLLATFTIPLRPLASPHRLYEKDLGADNWNLLLSMDRTVCDLSGQVMVVSSPIIVKNGFRIQFSEIEGNMVVTLTHVAETISFYGVQDLVETLLLASSNGVGEVSLCRPLRVINHIKGEAVRICRQDPSIMERQVLDELLVYWKMHLAPEDVCLHSKPIFTQIHSLHRC